MTLRATIQQQEVYDPIISRSGSSRDLFNHKIGTFSLPSIPNGASDAAALVEQVLAAGREGVLTRRNRRLHSPKQDHSTEPKQLQWEQFLKIRHLLILAKSPEFRCYLEAAVAFERSLQFLIASRVRCSIYLPGKSQVCGVLDRFVAASTDKLEGFLRALLEAASIRQKDRYSWLRRHTASQTSIKIRAVNLDRHHEIVDCQIAVLS